MMVVAATIVGGLIVGLKTPLFSPLIYLFKFKKDLFIILFFIYCLMLGYELEITNIYNIDPIIIFAVILPSILLLDVGLKGEDRSTVSYILIVVILIGWFIREVFVVSVLFALFYHFSKDNPRKGAFVTLTGLLLIVVGLIFGKSWLNMLGGSSTQVVFIAAISIIIFVYFFSQGR